MSDVDGTLLDADRRLAPATVQAARDLADAGVRLALASSRPPRGMVQFVLPLGITSPMAGFNGAQVVTPDLEGLIERPLDGA
ncbi:MAG: HAD hydrolase family protein, partial [Acidobacteria bacterium]|nr:HAD hydrolase family protein [Acidobacteriota bacterium]